MNKEISKPNIFITLLVTYLFYKVTLLTCKHSKIFKPEETWAEIRAREIINSVNNTKFIHSNPIEWKKPTEKQDNCIEYNGKITASIVRFQNVGPETIYLSLTGSISPNIASESGFFYNFEKGIVPRHIIKKLLSYKKGELLYVTWKNIIRDDTNKLWPGDKDITCSKILNEVRKPTPDEIEGYRIIDPELFQHPEYPNS